MDNLLLYLLEVSIGISLFYLSYILFLSRDTFYLRNRIFLIGALLLSILIPLMKVFNIASFVSKSESSNVINGIISSGTVIGANVSEKIISFDLNNLLFWIYFSISTLFLLRLLISVIRTLFIIQQGALIDPRFPKVIISDSDHPPFSFFPYIVIPEKTYESADYSQILKHENAHITQGHTFDLMLTELIISLLWFNPFIWLIKRSMVLNHEYLADNISIKGSCTVKEYQYKLLNIQAGLMSVPLAHNYYSLIKNRIIMINKRPTRNFAALKSIIILPVVVILFVMFSFKPDSDQANTGNQKPLFSKTSESEILLFLARNTTYPQEARNASDTGNVFVVVKMNKGGIVKECKAFTEKKGINVPFLEEIVIVGYKPSHGQGIVKNGKSGGNEHLALKTECLRMANKLAEVKLPEWKDKDMEFVIPIKFTLK
jgi:beta-lactamase regulating signal transducer with metallopeptidase domain